MTTKERHIYNHWWTMLFETRQKAGHMVSAGEVAKHAGTARSTAQKYLWALVETGTVLAYRNTHTNGYECTHFDVLDRYQS